MTDPTPTRYFLAASGRHDLGVLRCTACTQGRRENGNVCRACDGEGFFRTITGHTIRPPVLRCPRCDQYGIHEIPSLCTDAPFRTNCFGCGQDLEITLQAARQPKLPPHPPRTRRAEPTKESRR